MILRSAKTLKFPTEGIPGSEWPEVGVRLETAIAPVAGLAKGLPFYSPPPPIRVRQYVNCKGKNTSATKVPSRQVGLVLDLGNHILAEEAGKHL